MELTTPLLALALFAATLLGALPPVLRRWGSKSLHLFIALSAGVFLGSVFLHILPELAGFGGGAAHAGHDHGHAAGGGMGLGPWVAALAGFLGLFLLEKVWLRGYENPDSSDPHRLVWVSTYIALSLHAVAGGLGLAAIGMNLAVILPILWHKLTEAFSLTTVLRLAGLGAGRTWFLILLFALATPAGFLAGDQILHIGPTAEALLIGLAGGTFIYVAACDLLPEVFHDVEKPGPRVVALLLGVLAAGVFPHHATDDMSSGLFYELLLASWHVFLEMAPYLLVGFVVAGFISQWLDPDKLSRFVRKDNAASVAIASVVGAPLPLCSCSVVPVAASLRKAGASKGATSAFLVATPETGVDSISVTYGLMDPVMAVIRPVASVLSAIVTGLCVNVFVRSGSDDEPQAGLHVDPPKDCCSTEEEPHVHSHDHSHEVHAAPPKRSIAGALRFAFVDMLDDLAGALVLGVLLSGVISVLIPDSLFTSEFVAGHGGLFLMLLIGVPVYVCAASSTPIAATMMLKGLSPGAAIVFLLAGPATNLATLSVMTKYLGKRVVLVHILALSLVTLACGFATNALYGVFELSSEVKLPSDMQHGREPWQYVTAAVFGLLMLASFWRQITKDESGEGCSDHEH